MEWNVCLCHRHTHAITHLFYGKVSTRKKGVRFWSSLTVEAIRKKARKLSARSWKSLHSFICCTNINMYKKAWKSTRMHLAGVFSMLNLKVIIIFHPFRRTGIHLIRSFFLNDIQMHGCLCVCVFICIFCVKWVNTHKASLWMEQPFHLLNDRILKVCA